MTLSVLAKRVEAGYLLSFEEFSSLLPYVKNKDVWLDDALYKKSIDAVEKLRKELLPDWEINVGEGTISSFKNGKYELKKSGNWLCSYDKTTTKPICFHDKVKVTSTAPTESAARLAALLRALDKEKGENK